MANGYIIAQKNDGGTVTAYWDGTAFTTTALDADLLEADFIQTLTDARFVQGSVQAANTAVEVVKLAASETIVLL
ncbi:hypothetical protein CDG77_14030 [Nostoc sp. 'Peltigera membranacea cyanobiont' 213]|uniref:hypothetical protein n=1 Tax=Nostoc sp. 'Peltigera membranacea cyanobiont' 213 TaxID=2014530 RepID=UPI000B95B01B|nr:hypothetical protein [Nostoc sp. 'Peltigera membranacea cyanobiont' 213]OYD92767.1 hypothetical protein CDG77_14030 [Nostoc sp. 'Peltigera membranacea cyanobiont' 213]